jgi:putative transcriptional regulator
MSSVAVGTLLVAGTGLFDPNFIRTVVLICGRGDDGAFGIVLNRPTDIPVGDHLPGWVEQLARPEVVFVGGPVQPETAVGLARLRGSSAPVGFERVEGPVGLIDLSSPPGEATGHLSSLRVFSGYAGWGRGQLEAEVAAGDWHPVAAEAGDPFTADPGSLWRSVLRRQGGSLAWYADFPPHPSLN